MTNCLEEERNKKPGAEIRNLGLRGVRKKVRN